MGLREYRKKRNFRVTSEPRGGPIKTHKQLSFVVQKHAASHLHYDFRLELDGVLKSWAVPKGPSLDPSVKRLAMHVEDHPVEYGNFEGIIPKGEYGGGTVMLWDEGTWQPVDDAKKSYRDGSLKFELDGEKLRGKWMLVRKGGKRSGSEEKNWFLFKEKDEYAKAGSDIAVDEPLSVTTGRDLDAIAKEADRVWGPKGEVSQNGKPKNRVSSSTQAKKVQSRTKSPSPKPLTAAATKKLTASIKSIGTKRPIPSKFAVELATLVDEAPDTDDWMHEIKFDGYRMICRIADGKAKFISRNGKEWTAKFPGLAEDATKLPLKNAVLDGEVVILESDGKTSFQSLQNAFKSAEPASFYYYVFDLLYLNGFDTSGASIEERKELLKKVVPPIEEFSIRFSDHVIGKGARFFAEASRLGLEGIISKRLGRPYTAGRGNDWLKIKCSMREEFVIGGFTKPSGSRKHFGALLLGYYDNNQDLTYAGRVGTGFDDRTLASLRTQFEKLIHARSPFKNLAGTTGQAKDVTWLKPKLVAQVEFSNWTDEQQLRHPSFQGLREDKAASEVVRDEPVSESVVESAEKATKLKKGRTNIKAAGKKHSVQDGFTVAGVTLSHPDKILYPDDGITKADLARYYEEVADWILPQVTNRLLSLVRCPAGSNEKCFFQKHPGQGTSDLLERFAVREKNETEDYLALNDLAGIISLVQMGVLEIHIWGSTADQFEKPDRLIFDLDPDPAVEWPDVITAAKEVRLLLKELGLESFVKTTGGKGLHIVVPIQRRSSWAEAKTFCKAVADFMVAAAPDRYIAKMSKAARKGKIFVDYLRNDRGSTAIAPYSTRARTGATVSVPISWEELTERITPDNFNINNLPSRLKRLKNDPWAKINSVKQSITAAMLKNLRFK